MQQSNYQADILVDNVRWYVKLRWLYISSLGVAWLGGKIIFEGWDNRLTTDLVLLFVALIINFVFYLLARRPGQPIGYYLRLAIAELAADITTASIVLYEHGGVSARTIILYAIPIFVAGVLFGRITLMLTIAASALAYDFTVLLHAYRNDTLDTLGGLTIVLVLFYNTVFLMIGLVAKHSYDKSTQVLTDRNKELVAFNEAKDDFISIASHQLRTPATAVKQYIGMFLQGYVGELSKEQMEVLEKAYSSNERQIKIVNDLLRVASIDVNKIRLVNERGDLVDLVNNVIDEQRSEFISRHQKLKLVAPKQVMADFDRGLMHMALENIVHNASKYSPSGKEIRVNVRKGIEYVSIAVKDKGFGMSQQDQKKLFQKFSRIKNVNDKAVEGSGLGLYWAKKIIDLHGGSINVESSRGKGTTFTVNLPKSTV